jgi:hypothetical protein
VKKCQLTRLKFVECVLRNSLRLPIEWTWKEIFSMVLVIKVMPMCSYYSNEILSFLMFSVPEQILIKAPIKVFFHKIFNMTLFRKP